MHDCLFGLSASLPDACCHLDLLFLIVLFFVVQVSNHKMLSSENPAAQKAYEELRAFINNCPHVTIRQLLPDIRKKMGPQWDVLRDVEKSLMGQQFSPTHWKSAVISRLAQPGRFILGGDRVSHPGHVYKKCALRTTVA